MKNKSVRTEVQKSFLWNFKLYAFIGCLAFPLNVLGESVSFDTDNVAFMSPSQRIKVTGNFNPFVAQWVEGVDLQDCVQFATAAAALSVTRIGAQVSIPYQKEVIEFMRNRIL